MSEFEPDAKPFCDLTELKRLTEEWRVAQYNAEYAEKMQKAAEIEHATANHLANQALLRLRCHLQAMDSDRREWALPLDDYNMFHQTIAVVPLSHDVQPRILTVTQLSKSK